MRDYFIYLEQFLYTTNFQKLVTTDTSPIYNFKVKPYLPFHSGNASQKAFAHFGPNKEPEKIPLEKIHFAPPHLQGMLVSIYRTSGSDSLSSQESVRFYLGFTT